MRYLARRRRQWRRRCHRLIRSSSGMLTSFERLSPDGPSRSDPRPQPFRRKKLHLSERVPFLVREPEGDAECGVHKFEYVPHPLAALMILIAGAILARLLARSALIGAVNMRIQSARLISLAVKWLVLLVAIAMALDHLGIGRSILPLAFGIVFGGVVLAAALAVGLGARDVVSRTLEQQLGESSNATTRWTTSDGKSRRIHTHRFTGRADDSGSLGGAPRMSTYSEGR